MRACIVALVLLVAAAAAGEKSLKLLFGSCWHQQLHTYSAPVWQSVAREKADLFVFVGDAIYGDRRVFLSRFEASSAEHMRELYRQQRDDNDYKAAVASLRLGVRGVWDDHDYGLNNGRGSFAHKEVNKQLFLDFLGESDSSERRAAGSGLFGSYELMEGRVLLVLLDVRYWANATSVLGHQQWRALEDTLAARPRELVVVATGIQLLAARRPFQESWSDTGDERRRLVELLGKVKGRVVVLSGDVHYAELSCMAGQEGRPVVEATSSGLSHAWGESEAVTPSHHTTDHAGQPDSLWSSRTWVAALCRFAVAVLQYWPSPYALEGGEGWFRRVRDSAYFQRNYGVVEWDGATLKVEIRDKDGATRVAWREQSCPAFDETERRSREARAWATRVVVAGLSGLAGLAALYWMRQRR